MREKYNIAPDEFIDIDSYDPDQLSIDMFSADELNENGLVSYYGYDYKGDELNSATSIEDFFSEKNENEDFKEILVLLNLYIPQVIYKTNLLSMI